MMFFWYLFGPVDGWFLTGPNSKMERVEAGNNHVWNRMLDFFVARCWERVQSFDWAMHFFGEADGDGGVWAC